MRKLRLLFLLAILMGCTKAFAYDFMVNGIAYNITSTTDFTVAVTWESTYRGIVTIPSSVVHSSKTYSVTSIGSGAFENSYYLTSVTIPNSVTAIGNGAFQKCYRLTSVNITDLAAWCKIDFSGEYSNPLRYAYHLYLNGTEIKNLVIPSSVTSIGGYAFYNCSGLTSVTIGNSVKSIKYKAFYNCSSLSLVKITDLAAWCKIEFQYGSSYSPDYSSNPFVYANHLYMNGTEVKDLVIPSSVTSIGDYAFYGCSGLTLVTIPGSVYLKGVFPKSTKISSVNISNGSTSICKNAFSGCSGLTSVTIPNSVTSIGGWAFDGCSGLTAVHITDLSAWFNVIFYDNPLEYAHHLYLNGSEIKDLVIPNGVTKIPWRAFGGCSSLTSVTFPNSVTFIGCYAFDGCSGLTSVNITDLAAWCKVDFQQNGGNYHIRSINPLVYAHHLYLNGTEVKDLVIPSGVSNIANNFRGCSGLTSVTIPNSISYIDSCAFKGCSGLTSVNIPNSIAYIGSSAFKGCKDIKIITSKITSLFDFDRSAFENDVYANATLYVPADRKNLYLAHASWGRFYYIAEMPTAIQSVETDPKNMDGRIYDMQGREVLNPERGHIYIKDGKKILI